MSGDKEKKDGPADATTLDAVWRVAARGYSYLPQVPQRLLHSEASGAVFASGGVQWLLAGLWLRKTGWRYPFLLGWLVALGLHEVFDQASSSLLEVLANS